MSPGYAQFEEAYEVVQTALVVHQRQYYRIEVLQNVQKPQLDDFSTRVYIETSIKDGREVWARVVDFPWVRQNTSEAAMSQALSFLQAR
jgi:hypothetical protein